MGTRRGGEGCGGRGGGGGGYFQQTEIRKESGSVMDA